MQVENKSMIEKRDKLEKKIKAIIAEQLGISEDQVRPESSFMEDLGADSLDVVELVLTMEERLEIEIPDEDAENIKTVQDALDYVYEYNN